MHSNIVIFLNIILWETRISLQGTCRIEHYNKIQGHQYLALQSISKYNYINFSWYSSTFDIFSLIFILSDTKI